MHDQVATPAPPLERAFSVVAVAEAASWAGLLVGMYLKHVADATELGVRIFGSLHGALFVSYVALTLTLVRRGWPLRWTGVLALLAGVVPFATVAFERGARRRGLLAGPAATPVPAAIMRKPSAS